MESALTIVAPLSRASASASADLPEAVGPAMRTARSAPIIRATPLDARRPSVSHVATLISSPRRAAVTAAVLRPAREVLGAGEPVWLHGGVAADLPFRPVPGSQDGIARRLRETVAEHRVD